MSVRTPGQQVTFTAGPHVGRNGRSMGPVGASDVRVFVFTASEYVIVDVTDVEPASEYTGNVADYRGTQPR